MKNSLATNVEMADKLNHNYQMNMKAWGCIEKFSFLNKVYLNKDEHELDILATNVEMSEDGIELL